MRALEKERAIVMKPKRKEHRQIELHELNERKRFAAKRTEEKRKKTLHRVISLIVLCKAMTRTFEQCTHINIFFFLALLIQL